MAIVYKVVSVEPIMVEAIFPIKLSTPKVFIIFVAIAIEPLPEIGLNIARGIISGGKFKKFNIGEASFIIKSSTPELRRLLIATKSPINVGKILKVIFIPSLQPSRKVSNILILSFRPYSSTNSTTKGMARLER